MINWWIIALFAAAAISCFIKAYLSGRKTKRLRKELVAKHGIDPEDPMQVELYFAIEAFKKELRESGEKKEEPRRNYTIGS